MALAVLCTAVAFIVFFALIARVGPVRAPLFTYVNPVVAILLGALILGEELTLGLLIGFPLVILGCWLAATGGTIRVRRDGGGRRAHLADRLAPRVGGAGAGSAEHLDEHDPRDDHAATIGE